MLPFHFLMGVMLFSSTSMVVSASSWVAVWLAFEVNTLSFVPLIKSKNSSKYLLAQSVGSALILGGAAFGLDLMLMVGSALKAGIAPFHLWFPQVMESLGWVMCLVLSTWQKIAPLSVLACTSNSAMMWILVLFCSLMGSMGAMKQTQLRSVMAYSSIVHMGWVVASMVVSFSLSASYFFVYCMVSFFAFWKLLEWNSSFSIARDMSLVWLLCSMAGLPPFIGFLPKMLVLLKSSIIFAFPLVVGSVVMVYVYMNVAFSGVMKAINLKMGLITFFLMSAPAMAF